MDAYSEIFHEFYQKTVKYTGCSEFQCVYAGNADPRVHLSDGELYKVIDVSVFAWSTVLVLKGFEPYTFNSVCFEVVDENE